MGAALELLYSLSLIDVWTLRSRASFVATIFAVSSAYASLWSVLLDRSRPDRVSFLSDEVTVR